MARKTRTNTNSHRQIKKTIERDANSSNETDDEIKNIRKRT
jgi:hypothetical protein